MSTIIHIGEIKFINDDGKIKIKDLTGMLLLFSSFLSLSLILSLSLSFFLSFFLFFIVRSFFPPSFLFIFFPFYSFPSFLPPSYSFPTPFFSFPWYRISTAIPLVAVIFYKHEEILTKRGGWCVFGVFGIFLKNRNIKYSSFIRNKREQCRRRRRRK